MDIRSVNDNSVSEPFCISTCIMSVLFTMISITSLSSREAGRPLLSVKILPNNVRTTVSPAYCFNRIALTASETSKISGTPFSLKNL